MNTILKTYFEKSNVSLEQMSKKVSPNFEKFLSGEKSPSFNQLTKIASLLDIPVGLLLLEKPIKQSKPTINFRTINSEYIANPSSELKDTISEMKEKQDFLREEINYELNYIGKFSINDNYLVVANYARKLLKLPVNYYEQRFTFSSQLSYLRKKISNAGVFVFFNGKIKDNTYRTLNLDEFRGFVLLDLRAPIIFINQKDTKNGQVFTLIHEFIHLLLGDEEILGSEPTKGNFDPVEAFVNKITSEILVPDAAFRKQKVDIKNLEDLANHFKVSKFVILRRMKDDKYISSRQYLTWNKKLTQEFHKYELENKKKSSGGNYKNNLNFRIDRTFFNYVQNAVNTQQITYTDAFNIIGVGYKGYQSLRKG